MNKTDIKRILDEWYAGYSRSGPITENVFLALENRLIPLSPGEPVQFRETGKQRWLNGTFDGPVGNPADPYRKGDAWVTTSGGRRVPVFLSSVRRRHARPEG